MDAGDPGTLLDAESAFFVHSSSIRSPMGGGLLAFSESASAQARADELEGERLTWSEVQSIPSLSSATDHH
jgi:nitrous oxide reductase accessory protein NosL